MERESLDVFKYWDPREAKYKNVSSGWLGVAVIPGFMFSLWAKNTHQSFRDGISVFWFVRISSFHYTYKKLAWILDKRFRGWQLLWIPAIALNDKKESRMTVGVLSRMTKVFSFRKCKLKFLYWIIFIKVV
mgnify:FL=1